MSMSADTVSELDCWGVTFHFEPPVPVHPDAVVTSPGELVVAHDNRTSPNAYTRLGEMMVAAARAIDTSYATTASVLTRDKQDPVPFLAERLSGALSCSVTFTDHRQR